jgi:hypothetical protein
MSAASFGVAIQSARVEFCACRWGGGAEPGKWHVFAIASHGDWDAGLLKVSQSAVIDDFGNLVRVPG